MSKFNTNNKLSAQQELFMRDYDLSNSPFLRALGHAICFLAFLIFGYVCFSSFKYAYPPANLEEITLIRKEISPVKISPDNPGGEQFLNQDKFIYNSLEDNVSKTHIKKRSNDSNPSSPSLSKIEKQKDITIPIKPSAKEKELIKQPTKTPEIARKVKPSTNKADSVFNVLE